MQKHHAILAVLAAASVASTSGTRAAGVIGDFEGALDAGWVVNAGTGEISTDWSSTGTSSLKLTHGAAGFAWALQFNNVAALQDLTTDHVLKLDVHWISSQWQPDSGTDAWIRWDIASVNSATSGWVQITNNEITDPANPSYPGSWDPNNWGTEHTRTLTYDFTGTGADLTGAGWAQFNLATNFGNTETIGAYYIDNVRTELIPEPAAAALLGLGALAAGLRRRRA